MAEAVRLELKPEPDGFGFIYGRVFAPDRKVYRIDIMPPIGAWRGDIKLTGAGAPHPTDWVVYMNGEEIARARRRDDIDRELSTRLLDSNARHATIRPPLARVRGHSLARRFVLDCAHDQNPSHRPDPRQARDPPR